MGRGQHFFHGTTADVGDVVRPAGRGAPGSIHNSQGYRFGQRADEHAFVTEHEHEAWQYADMSTAGRRAANLSSNGPWTGRQRVYRTTAAPDQRIGAYHPDHPDHARRDIESWHEHVSRTGFPVVERLDIKPGHQGTFPIDWRPYSRNPGAHPILEDVNHPKADDVAYGHTRSTIRQVRSMAELAEWTAREYPKPNRPVESPGQLHLSLGPQFQPKEA